MPIFIGTSTKNQQAISLGSTQMQRVYIGDKLVWEKVPVGLAFEVLFDNIANAETKIGGSASSLSVWNSFYNGANFTAVQVIGNLVKLYGGTNVKIYNYKFVYFNHIISVCDYSGAIVRVYEGAFTYCDLISTMWLPNCIRVDSSSFQGLFNVTVYNLNKLQIAGSYAFDSFTKSPVTEMYLPELISAGEYFLNNVHHIKSLIAPKLVTVVPMTFRAISQSVINYDLRSLVNVPASAFLGSIAGPFYFDLRSCTNLGGSVGLNDVFKWKYNLGTLRIPISLMTCNGGNPDGDVMNWMEYGGTILDPSGNQIYP